MLELADTSEECGTTNILFIPLNNSASNIDCYMHQTDSKQGKAFGHISHCTHKSHMHKHEQAQT